MGNIERQASYGAKTMAITEKSQAIMSVSILQRLYDSEINFEVSCFWDAGFDVRLGDAVNGFLDPR
jgi:hypothetical protein